jgi:hypothetical protein
VRRSKGDQFDKKILGRRFHPRGRDILSDTEDAGTDVPASSNSVVRQRTDAR